MYIYVYLFLSITIKYLILFYLFFLQIIMSFPIVVFYGGQWNGCNIYENYLVAEILVDVRVSFNSLVDLICEQIQLDG